MGKMSEDLLTILPQIILLLTAMSALVFEMLRKPLGSLYTLIIGMLGALGLSIYRLGTVKTAFSGTFRSDELSQWAVIILSGAAIFIGLLVRQELKGTDREGTVYSLLAFSTLGSTLLAGSGDMMFLVLGVLISSLTGFALAAYPKTDSATEGAVKYFVYGSVTGAIMLFGLTYWAGISGSTLLSASENTNQPFLMLFGFGALIAGLGYAASLFPFHFWTPDTFEGAPVSIAAFLSVTPKIGAFFALAQVMKILPQHIVDYNLILAILAAFSMTYGNVVALWQNSLIRLLAYSTIAQAGFFLLGIIGINHSDLGISSLIMFGFAYAAMNIGAFAIVQQVGKKISHISGLAYKKPFMAVAMTVFLLSLVGIPPLAGFAGKFLLFSSAIDSGYTWLAVVGILNSAISLAVYLRIISPMFFKKQFENESSNQYLIQMVYISCFILTIGAGIAVQVIIV
ncbi:NADH-quinone oxidoreductase subunit N [Salegentibacter echinorum]|uniref:NADH-quinone oxidoreductase subunit N n=1 Tax=Salegentibacter echinorum TaxID=1073325 RepID=A0A1M5BKV9_SALEC|nr:NADH-quinone oxidoreductase subunit N [Salegentibacter echinorum]SHF43109.1 NADH-quinone oxidoreductase subunit N [Salegentibacter echinorum]